MLIEDTRRNRVLSGNFIQIMGTDENFCRNSSISAKLQNVRIHFKTSLIEFKGQLPFFIPNKFKLTHECNVLQ